MDGLTQPVPVGRLGPVQRELGHPGLQRLRAARRHREGDEGLAHRQRHRPVRQAHRQPLRLVQELPRTDLVTAHPGYLGQAANGVREPRPQLVEPPQPFHLTDAAFGHLDLLALHRDVPAVDEEREHPHRGDRFAAHRRTPLQGAVEHARSLIQVTQPPLGDPEHGQHADQLARASSRAERRGNALHRLQCRGRLAVVDERRADHHGQLAPGAPVVGCDQGQRPPRPLRDRVAVPVLVERDHGQGLPPAQPPVAAGSRQLPVPTVADGRGELTRVVVIDGERRALDDAQAQVGADPLGRECRHAAPHRRRLAAIQHRLPRPQQGLHRGLLVAGREELLHRFGHVAPLQVPPGRRPPGRVRPLRMAPLHLLQQGSTEERVVPVRPGRRLASQEHAAPGQPDQRAAAVRPPGHLLAQRGVEAAQRRRAEQELPVGAAQHGQDLRQQVLGQVVGQHPAGQHLLDRATGAHRQGHPPHRHRPALGGRVHLAHRRLGQWHPGALGEEGPRLVQRETKVRLAELPQTALRPHRGRRPGRVRAGGEQHEQGRGPVAKQDAQAVPHVRALDQVGVLEHQHGRHRHRVQLVEQRGHDRPLGAQAAGLQDRLGGTADLAQRGPRRRRHVRPEAHRVVVPAVESDHGGATIGGRQPLGHQRALAGPGGPLDEGDAAAERVVDEAQQPGPEDDTTRPPGQAQLAVQHLAGGSAAVLCARV